MMDDQQKRAAFLKNIGIDVNQYWQLSEDIDENLIKKLKENDNRVHVFPLKECLMLL